MRRKSIPVGKIPVPIDSFDGEDEFFNQDNLDDETILIEKK